MSDWLVWLLVVAWVVSAVWLVALLLQGLWLLAMTIKALRR